MIDDSLALPLYHQLAGILRQRIEEGTYAAGERLPSEDEFTNEFEVSRATVRQAIAELAHRGLVVRRQGRGTFVEMPDASQVLNQRFRGSLSDLMAQSHRATTRDLEISHLSPFPIHVGAALGLSEPVGTAVSRTRLIDGEPFSYTISYLPSSIGKHLTLGALRRSALMDVLQQRGVGLHSATQSIRAHLADLDLCSRIDIELGSAVLYVERLVRDSSDKPVEFVRSWYRGDRYEYTVTLDLDTSPNHGPYTNLA